MNTEVPLGPDALRLLKVIAGQINSGRIREGQPETFLAYSEALELLGESNPSARSGARLSNLGLKELHHWLEEHQELPKVTGLIVNKSNRRPHQDYAKWHGHGHDPDWETWWMDEVNRAIRYDWSPYVSDHLPGPLVSAGESKVKEDEVEYGHGTLIVANPPPARIRRSGITVSEVLQWMASGESENDILRHHPGLKRQDIRASLAYAAEREQRAAPTTESAPSRLSSVASKWQGKFTLPTSDENDPRMDYLLKKYWKNRE